MAASKLSFGNTLPFLALFGPIVYVSNAMIELGRLEFFNAPSGFVQLTSFGFSSIIGNSLEILFILILNLLILFGTKYLRGWAQVGQYFLAISFTCGIAAYYSLTPIGWWGFGSVFACGLIYGMSRDLKSFKIKNEPLVSDSDASVDDWKDYADLSRRLIFISVTLLLLLGLFYKVGQHSAANQTSYWISGDEVIFGFYGDHALVGVRDDHVVGVTFKLKLIRELASGMTRLDVGPLVPASRWVKTLP
ncbi:hypothetical protein [Pseudomonas syringae]|uniref:Uncharacterized protein n=1 Tax=Pseudomonas syringae UB303 TaxID=1357287 RepID=A0AAJ4E4M0_PSESX|nr:hypothetical protein [Pseudomonas syringae]QHF08625.1 hypothetical protein N026_14575 [Pseudomonas syringae UB303]